MKMGLLIALIPSVAFGFTGIVLTLIGGNVRQQYVGQTLGAALFGLIFLPFLPATYTPEGVVVSVISGVFLSLGIATQLAGFKCIGVSGVMPITTGLQLVLISVAGVVIFGEWATPQALAYGLTALALLVFGATATAYRQRGKTKISPENLRRGLLLTLICTVFFSLYPLVVRYYDVDGFGTFLPQACGAAVTAVLLSLWGPRRDTNGNLLPADAVDGGVIYNRRTVRLLLPGILWGSGVMLLMYSNERVGVATGFSLSQLGVIISTFGGIFILKESRTRREMVLISLGVAALVVGALLVGVAKGYDL